MNYQPLLAVIFIVTVWMPIDLFAYEDDVIPVIRISAFVAYLLH